MIDDRRAIYVELISSKYNSIVLKPGGMVMIPTKF